MSEQCATAGSTFRDVTVAAMAKQISDKMEEAFRSVHNLSDLELAERGAKAYRDRITDYLDQLKSRRGIVDFRVEDPFVSVSWKPYYIRRRGYKPQYCNRDGELYLHTGKPLSLRRLKVKMRRNWSVGSTFFTLLYKPVLPIRTIRIDTVVNGTPIEFSEVPHEPSV